MNLTTSPIKNEQVNLKYAVYIVLKVGIKFLSGIGICMIFLISLWQVTYEQELGIPTWIKNNARWWSEGKVADTDFIQGIQYLIQHGIMKIPHNQSISNSSNQIPSWVRNDATLWSQGQISDDEFVKGIQYLISIGIIRLS